jgi:hypothetical protein
MENLLKEIFGGRPAGTILMLWGRLKDIFMGGGLSMNKLFAALLILGQILGIMTLDIGLKPAGQKLDLDKFSLVWSDEFDGSEIDRNIWDGHYVYGDAAEIRCGGYWHRSLAHLRDGNLIIETKYLEEGIGGRGPGYYSYGMDTRGRYEQLYGYFEVRCIFPAAQGLWSAFWMINDNTFNVDGYGRDGTEVDVFESTFYKDNWWGGGNALVSGIVFDGYGPESKGTSIGKYRIKGDPYKEFHTYGLEWNPDEYIFYIDGVETGRTSYGGVSQNPEWLILSIEVSGKDGVAHSDRHGTGFIEKNKNWPAEFVVDYVRAYQYKEYLDR